MSDNRADGAAIGFADDRRGYPREWLSAREWLAYHCETAGEPAMAHKFLESDDDPVVLATVKAMISFCRQEVQRGKEPSDG